MEFLALLVMMNLAVSLWTLSLHLNVKVPYQTKSYLQQPLPNATIKTDASPKVLPFKRKRHLRLIKDE